MKTCFENLQAYLKECEPCRMNSFIIEFEQLPEKEKQYFDYYDKDKDLILYCTKCNIYQLIPTENN